MNTLPATTWQMLSRRLPSKPLPQGLDAAWDTAAGQVQKFIPHSGMVLKRAQKILQYEKDFSDIAESKLRARAQNFKEIFRLNRETPEDLDCAFALIREIAYRKIGEKPYPVQVAGALALNSGCVAEMATGEGKTLTATMTVTVAGWRGKGCHVLTVNDYLAQRDSEWMKQLYNFCGLSVGCVQQGMKPKDRRNAYDADITYCTNKEVAADFLRDRLILGQARNLGSVLIQSASGGKRIIDRLVQRGLNFAVVDEADSILVDEAVTPLIISGDAPNPDQVQAFNQARDIVSDMEQDIHYTVNPQYREIELTDLGKARIESANFGSLWKGVRRSEELVIQALTARQFYLKDKNYIVDEEKIVIVDEFTGRLMPDRTWRDGLHQAIEAKEGLTVNEPKDTYARISFQRFFRLYQKLSGMTGTAKESSGEFWQIYHLPVAVIPTNKPCIRKLLPTKVYPTEDAKWTACIKEIQKTHATERPILIGTRSIAASEHLSDLLEQHHLPHQVLNARLHMQEAQIVAQAGQPGKITVATNMAGRGTDIKLGRGIADLGGLHVLSAQLNESARIDRQLYGRGARQGDPGSAQAIISLQDEIIKRYSGRLAGFLAKRHKSSDHPISPVMTKLVISSTHNKSEKMALRQRKSVLKTDHWLDEQLGFTGAE